MPTSEPSEQDFRTADVSVVVPVYGPPVHFLEALASVAAQQPGEILVVDDASPNPLPDLSAFGPLRVVRHAENRGPGAARNTGLKEASLPWVSFIDADDLWVPGRLLRQLDLARIHQAQVVLGQTSFMGPNGGPDPAGRENRYTPIMATMLMRTEIARALPQDESSNFAEDLDFYIQLKERGYRLHKHEDPVLFYRQHPHSLTAGREAKKIKGDLVRVLARSLARRRAPQPAVEEGTIR